MQTVFVQRRALRYTNDLEKGHVINDADLIAVRPIPDNGIAPYRKGEILGKSLIKNVLSDDLVKLEDF